MLGSWKRIYERDVYIGPKISPTSEHFPGPCLPSTPGYAITPIAAATLLAEFSNTYTASDCAVRSSIVDIKIHSHLMGYALTQENGKIFNNQFNFLGKMKAFIMSLSCIESSTISAKSVMRKLKEYKFNVELFEGKNLDHDGIERYTARAIFRY